MMSAQKEEVISRLKKFFKDNADRWPITMSFLYGSWGGGYPNEDSDVDIAVVFSEEVINNHDKFSIINDISYELTQIFPKDINLISINRDFSHPLLYYNAVVMGIPIFIKNIDEYIPLKMEAIFQKDDFSLFGIQWQLDLAQMNFRR